MRQEPSYTEEAVKIAIWLVALWLLTTFLPACTTTPLPPQETGSAAPAVAGELPASFTVNKAGLEIAEYYEGLRTKAYKDRVGVWTLCFGRTHWPDGRAVKEGDTCTLNQAESWLLADMEREGAHFVRAWTKGLSENQFSALVDLSFNRGAGRLRALLDMSHSNAEIAENLLKFDYAGTEDNHLLGLKRRRRSDRALFLGQPWETYKEWTP